MFPVLTKSPSSLLQFQTVLSYANNAAKTVGASNITLIVKYAAAALKQTGSTVQLTIQGSAGGSTTCTAAWIGLPAASGNAYNFDGNQVQFLFNGNGTPPVIGPALTNTVTSDNLSFTIDGSKAVLIAFNINSGSFPATLASQTNLTSYIKPGVSQAGTAAKDTSGYVATAGANIFVKLLQAE